MSVSSDNTDSVSLIEERVFYSRKLGSDQNLVLHGGGNTSVKTEEIDHTGSRIKVLRVKGSGSDLATITERGFTGLRMNDMLSAMKIDKMSDQEMVDFMKKSMVDPSEPSPSVESFLHAFIPDRFVDHSHSDAILSITNTPLSPEDIRKIFRNVLVIPYIPPGFKLARAILSKTQNIPEGTEGIILSKHGLFTFGKTGEESYSRHLKIVQIAESYIASKSGKDLFKKEFEEIPDDAVMSVVPEIRGKLSSRHRKILRIENTGIARDISLSKEAQIFEIQGPATPDMLIRTKYEYAYVDRPEHAPEVIDKFVERYKMDYNEYVKGFPMHDPYPAVIVIRGFGLITAGISDKETLIVRDQFIHSMIVNSRARKIAGNAFISKKEAYEMEYWPLEEAKLKKMKPRFLQGTVSIVTGAANGIGLEAARKLSENGSIVIACDMDPSIETVAKELQKSTQTTIFPYIIDISDEAKVTEMFRTITMKFGAVDILFNNAGVLKSDPIEKISMEELDFHYRVNSRGTFLMTKEAFKFMKAQKIGGNIVFNISKNLTHPGPEMLSYGSSKAFAAQICHYVSKEGGAFGIRANIINPDKVFKGSKIWENGVLESRAKAKGQTVEEYKTQNLLRREVLPEHVANVLLSLVNEEVFGATTDAMIPVDGGIK